MRKALTAGIFSVITIAMLITLVQVSNLGYASGQTSLSLGASQTVVPAQNIVPSPPNSEAKPNTHTKGVPAITPPLTEARVRDYLTQQPMLAGVEARNVQPFAVQFTTGSGVAAILKDNDPFWGYYADDALVFVSLSGEFSFYDMDNVQHTNSSSYKVFDGHTGNLLREGIVNKQTYTNHL